jgi:hypothetical protein
VAQPDGKAAVVSFERAQAAALRSPRYGNGNPERIENAFWELMIRQRRQAYWARDLFGLAIEWAAHRRMAATSAWRDHADGPVFCFTRFGRSVTQLPDGRLVYVGGEHEDWYDPDFCIYNDVVVEHPDGNFDVYVYPRDTFPPTDFHSATLVGSEIYLIGSLGYKDQRQVGETPVYVLDTDRFSIRCLPTTGDAPGWISYHAAVFNRSSSTIRVTGGQIATLAMTLEPNAREFSLDLKTGHWRVGAGETTS